MIAEPSVKLFALVTEFICSGDGLHHEMMLYAARIQIKYCLDNLI